MSQYSRKNFSDTASDVADCFAKWGVRDWEIVKGVTGSRMNSPGLSPAERAVTLRWKARGEMRELSVSKWRTPRENARAAFLALDSIRLNEHRGIADTIAAFYQALPAPKQERDPYEILGVRPDADPDDVEAMYRAKAKRLHPDVGGDPEAMKELNAAYEKVRAR